MAARPPAADRQDPARRAVLRRDEPGELGLVVEPDQQIARDPVEPVKRRIGGMRVLEHHAEAAIHADRARMASYSIGVGVREGLFGPRQSAAGDQIAGGDRSGWRGGR